jgi:putative sterol carrier protein
LKKEGAVIKGKGANKADAILSLKDADFIDLASGKLNGMYQRESILCSCHTDL